MKNKGEILQEQLDQVKKGNTTEIQFCYSAIFSAMEEYKQQEVEKLNLPVVVQQRKLLIAFLNSFDADTGYIEMMSENIEPFVDDFLSDL